jgi:hypothetical protein
LAPPPARSEAPIEGRAPRARRRTLIGGIAAAALVAVAASATWWVLREEEDPRLRFAPPVLEDPETVSVDAATADLRLDAGQDYIIQMPAEPLDVEGGLQITGGDDVVLIGGEVRLSRSYGGDPRKANRGLYLVDQTGTVHIEGLRIAGELTEGINLSQSTGATVQLQNVAVERVVGSRDGNHADVVQTWAGPDRLYVDGLLAATTYQGLFLIPNQLFDGPAPTDWRLHDVVVEGEGSGYLYWLDAPDPFPVLVDDVWAEPTGDDPRVSWWEGPPGDDPWSDVEVGTAPGRLRDGPGSAGLDYTSPGYRD